MNLEVLNVLEKSVNAIMAVELPSMKVISDNRVARELFSINKTQIRLSTLFFSLEKAMGIMSQAQEELKTKQKFRIWDTEVMGSDREKIPCDVEFSYVNDSKQHMFLKVRPVLDNKTYYLEKFIETRKRPAFTLSKTGPFIVNLGNEAFYKSFACNKETIHTRYKGEFVRFLHEEGRDDDEKKIRDAMAKSPNGIVDIPIQTAYGDTLWLYYDLQKLKQLEKEIDTLIFCLLVKKTDRVEDLTDPFDL